MTARHALGQLVRLHRLDARLTQQALASRAGISVRTLRDIEQDRIKRPQVRSVEKIVEALRLAPPDRDLVLATFSNGAPSDHRLRVGVLGPLLVRRGKDLVEVMSPMQRSLLGLLCLHPGQVVSYAEIVDVLWGEHPPKTCLHLVHGYIRKLRALLEPGSGRDSRQVVSTSPGGYRLHLEIDQLDLVRFDDLVARAQAPSGNDASARLGLFRQALSSWRGPLLADVAHPVREHPTAVALNQRRLKAIFAAAETATAIGSCQEAVDWLAAVTPEEPLHEGLYARLMLALAGCGQQAQAVARYHEIRARLADQLGLAPGTELTAAHRRVLRQQVPVDRVDHLHQAVVRPAPAGPTPVRPGQLPADLPVFVGRTTALARLDALLPDQRDRPAAAPTVVVIEGAAGVGKTALAVRWAHQVAHRFHDGQLYLDLRGFSQGGPPMEPRAALQSLLETLGVPRAEHPYTVDARLGLFRSLLARRRVLLVLDNARDTEQVRPFLPGSEGCLVVVTSRSQLTGLVAVSGAHPLALEPLTPVEARELLTRRLGAVRAASYPDAIGEILEACAGLPLALAIASTHATRWPQRPLTELAAVIRQGSGLDAFDCGDGVTDLRQALSWSYRCLSPAAARLLRLVGRFAGHTFSTSDAARLAGVSAVAVRPALAELRRLYLVGEPADDRFTLTPLLRTYIDELAALAAPAAPAALGRRA